MRITKTADMVSNLKIAQQIANTGCNICPCCGETKSSTEYLAQGFLTKGILTGLQKTWAEGGLFKLKNMKCDCYTCLTCGAEWESEPYEWT